MAAEHYTILTNKGAAKIAEAIQTGRQIEITQMALGDGNGSLPQPQSSATALVRECYRAPINSATNDKNNSAWVIFEQVLAPDVGGWWIREIGLYDKEGDLIAVGNYPEQYKPLLTEGASTTQTVSVVIQVLSSDAITLKVDPSVVLATRQYVDEASNLILSELDKQIYKSSAALNEIKKQMGGAASMRHSGLPLNKLSGEPDDVVDTAQLVELREKVKSFRSGAEREVFGKGDIITTEYFKEKLLYKVSSQTFSTTSDYVMRSVSGTETIVPEDGTYIVAGSVRAWAESNNASNAATFWAATFLRQGDRFIPESSGVNTSSGNRDATAPIFGVASAKAGDVISTGFLHNQGDAWEKIHLYSSLIMIKIGN